MNEVAVYASPLPFSNKRINLVAPAGARISDIVNLAVTDKFRRAGVTALVDINGEPLPKQYWHRVRPRPGAIVNVRIVPQGGGGGGKNPVATLLSIAVMVAAPYVSGAILGSTLAGTAAFGTVTYGQILTAALGAVGRLAVNALAPPPKPSNAGVANISNPAESPTQFIEGARNVLDPFGVVPVCLGTNRMFPKQAARPYTETQDNNQYVRQMFTYGWGPQVIISDLKIGETAISEFTDFEVEHRLNGDLHEGTALFSNDVFQEDMSVLITQAGGYVTRTTQIATDEVIVDFTFGQGLTEYDSNGGRNSRRVQLELTYAETGTSPQVWSPGAATYTDFSGAVLAIDAPVLVRTARGENPTNITRTDLVVIDQYSGTISVVKGSDGSNTPAPTPANAIVLANVTVNLTRASNGVETTDITVTDIRQTALFGSTLEDSGSFVPSKTGAQQVTISAGAILVNDLDILGNQKEALRKSVRVKFPTPGQYDLRVRRITADSSSDQVFDEVALTAIKSVKYQNPVNLQGINGTAVRIKATDQLNGALDQFNAIVSNVIPDYDADLDDWVPRATSNPASIYRYLLQGAANARALDDSKINISDLEDWHTHCVEQGYTYNRVIDYETSLDEVLRDVASAGAASPAIVDGKRTIAIDRAKDDVVQVFTPRNSWGYSGELEYPEIPHAFRVQFRNADKGYAQDEIIVYDDGYTESNATNYEALELQSCTNAELAFKTGRRHIAGIRLRPENHTFFCDVENIVALRGDRIKLVHDVPVAGVGDGRIKEVLDDGGSPAMVTGIVIDDVVTIPTESEYYVRIRCADGSQFYKRVIAPVGPQTSFSFAEPFEFGSYVDSESVMQQTPSVGDLCAFVEAGGELDLIITRIEPQEDLAARITAINYAQPDISRAENAPIPAHDSKVTIPLEFVRPLPPLLLDEQSDESVMLLNSDGSYTPRAVFTLQNRNEGDIQTSVKVRISGTSVFTNADVLEATPERLVITGLEDGKRYDVHIRYKRSNSTQYSQALELNNYLFVGASSTPDDVTGFTINVLGDTALLKWNANDDIDLNYYTIKFSPAYSGASWATALTLEPRVFENRVTVPFLGGTYLIKAVDRLLNESENATAIITYDPGAIKNVIATVTEAPDFGGAKDNVIEDAGVIVLEDPDVLTGYYYFEDMVDLTGVYPAFVSAEITANGTYINDLFDEVDLFEVDDLFGAGSTDLAGESDLFALDDLFGIGTDAWAVELQYSTIQDDPNNSPAVWSDWAPLDAGTYEFWAIKFRLKMTSYRTGISPQVSQLTVKVDMPDRIERGEDLPVPDTGATVNFTPAFKETPAVLITIQDGEVDDKIEFTAKGPSGFSFKVYNATAAGYVARSFDFVASGYGRLNES